MRPHKKDVDVLRTSDRENQHVWRRKISSNRMIEDLLVNNLFFFQSNKTYVDLQSIHMEKKFRNTSSPIFKF